VAASKTLTPEQRTLRARIAANSRWSQSRARADHADRHLQRYAAEVDPDGKLPEPERIALAKQRRRAHMQKTSPRQLQGPWRPQGRRRRCLTQQNAAPAEAASRTRRTSTPMVSQDLRRRRDAAWRLPPLEDGTRDPIDALAGKPIPRRPIECPGMFGDNGKWKPCCGRDAT
jgi:hypothetical protein